MVKKTGRVGAPLGNQNAKGHGKPPNPNYTDDDLHRLGEEFVSWMKHIDRDGVAVVHLSEWYSEIKEIPRSQWQSICNRDCFRDYYDRARLWMGRKLLKNKDLPQAYGSRFIAVYFKEIAEHERSIVEHKVDYELTKKVDIESRKSIPPNDHILSLNFGLINENHKLKEKIQSLESKLLIDKSNEKEHESR